MSKKIFDEVSDKLSESGMDFILLVQIDEATGVHVKMGAPQSGIAALVKLATQTMGQDGDINPVEIMNHLLLHYKQELIDHIAGGLNDLENMAGLGGGTTH